MRARLWVARRGSPSTRWLFSSSSTKDSSCRGKVGIGRYSLSHAVRASLSHLSCVLLMGPQRVVMCALIHTMASLVCPICSLS